MSTKISYRYQLSSQAKPIAVYYFIVITVVVLLSISMLTLSYTTGETSRGQIAGFEISTIIFIFVAGCNSFREEFYMLTQNGVSRKSLFWGRLLTSLTVALGMAVIGKMIYFICKAIYLNSDRLSFTSLFEMLKYYEYSKGISGFKTELISLVFYFALYLFATAIGYLLATVFYRLGKNGRVALSVSLPVGLFVVLPMLDGTIAKGKIFALIFRTLNKAFGLSVHQPVYGIITCLIAFIILSALSWLCIRRAYVKD